MHTTENRNLSTPTLFDRLESGEGGVRSNRHNVGIYGCYNIFDCLAMKCFKRRFCYVLNLTGGNIYFHEEDHR
jgi:hypothetical protein